MKNKDGFIVCDQTHIILNDGVTLYPLYLEIKDKDIIQYWSDDPNNAIPYHKRPAVIRNRVEYIRQQKVGSTTEELNGKHFINISSMQEYVRSRKPRQDDAEKR